MSAIMKHTALKLIQKILKLLSQLILKRYEPGIIGVTGNVGKTSTKEAIRVVLQGERAVRASSKNFNNELGLPLSILGDWKDTGGVWFWIKVIFGAIGRLIITDSSYPEVLVLEYGVDRVGDMKYLLDIARPHIGVFSAMGEIPVHVEFFAGTEGILREKAKLIQHLPTTGFAILNADDERVMSVRDLAKANVITFGFSEGADMRISNFQNYCDEDNAGVKFKLTYGGSTVPVTIEGSVGKTPAYATAIASIVGLIFGMNLVKTGEALSKYASPKGRERVIPGIKHSLVIDDTYNASPLAMQEALQTLGSIKAKRRIAVLGDMLELGKHTLAAHEAAGKTAADTVDMLFTVGVRAKTIAEAAAKNGLSKKKIFAFTNIYEAGMQLQQKVQKGDVILVKGSQGVRMERIVKEVMAEPLLASELLVRQSSAWFKKQGLYD